LKRALIFTGIGALLVGLAFLVGRANLPDPATDPAPYVGKRGASRAKTAGLELHFSRAGIEEKLGPASVLRAGDSLRIVVRGERARYVEVRLRDGAADPTTVFPAGAAETALVQPRETLPIRPTLGAGGAKVIVTALFTDRVRPVGAPADEETEVVTLAIAKE
jgi:hypothetical protein